MDNIQKTEESSFFDIVRGRRDYVIVKQQWENNVYFIYWYWRR